MSNMIVHLFIIFYLFNCVKVTLGASLYCTFNKDFCGWSQDRSNKVDWKRHTGTDGEYIYFHVSQNDKSETSGLISQIQSPGRYCLTFWYRINGEVGELNVYIMKNKIKSKIFQKNESTWQGPWWSKSVLDLVSYENFQIVLEGHFREGSYFLISIDDVSMKSGYCFDCDFEDGFCNWIQYNRDNFDWARNRGKTNTESTGPSADHTTGDGYYIYIEASLRYNHDKAILLSPSLDAGKYCVSFWYYMYGLDIDRLRLLLWYTNRSTVTLSEIQSAHGQQWKQKLIFVPSQVMFKIAFEGRVENDWSAWRSKHGIALDDVKLFSCHDCSDPTPNHGRANSTNYAYGSAVEIKCDHGYILKGNYVIVCGPMERWNGNITCMPHDCGIRTIPNGTFITPNGTTFGQVGRQECDNGFVLIGEENVRCTINGWFNSLAYCEMIDCGNLTIPNGIFITPNGTTFGQVGKQECDSGFVLIGEQNITCTVYGWSNKLAYCQMKDAESLESATSPLVVAYVSIPVIVLIFATVVTVVYMRKNHSRCINIFKTDGKSRNVPTGDSLNRQNQLNPTYDNEAEQINDEYATIAEGSNNNNGLDTVCYAVVNKKNSRYSNEHHSAGREKTFGEDHRNGLSKYDVPRNGHIDLNIPSGSNKEHDSVYDNTFTGKMKTNTLSHDDYSHLGDVDPNYQHPFNLDIQTNVQDTADYAHLDGVKSKRQFDTLQPKIASIVEDTKIPDKQAPKATNSLHEEPDYYNVGTDVEDTDKNGERESDNVVNHDYFILEKT